MSQTHRQPRSSSIFSIFLVAGSVFTVLIFYAIIWILSSSVVNQSGVITRTRMVFALSLMLVGMITITIGGSLFLMDM